MSHRRWQLRGDNNDDGGGNGRNTAAIAAVHISVHSTSPFSPRPFLFFITILMLGQKVSHVFNDIVCLYILYNIVSSKI